MKKRKFPFLKCCEVFYQSALGAGILFIIQGFFQKELSLLAVFPEQDGLSLLIAAGSFAACLLIRSLRKGYRLHAILGVTAVSAAAVLFSMQQPESRMALLCYAGLEAACAAGAAAVYAIRHFPVLKGALVLAQAGGLIYLAILKKPLPGWCVCMMLAAFLIFLSELTAKTRKDALGLAPLFAAAMLIVSILPQDEKPMDWSWVGDLCTAAGEKAEMLMVDIAYMFEGENEFSFSFAGYGSEGGLGGSVFENDRAQLRITGAGTKNPLYLTGEVYDAYTGEGWIPAARDGVAGAQLDSGQDGIIYAIGQSVYSGHENLTSSAKVSVEYRFIKTADFFHDLHTTNLYFPDEKPQFEKDAPWTMQSAHGKDFTYQLCFLEINEHSDEIKAIMRQQAWREDAVWDDEIPPQADMLKACTGLPDALPQRVYELSHAICAGAGNDYDRMTALAAYLQDFSYTKSPPNCPDGREFTDYFLFDGKRGYCTYFATALAVLGRCEGIPTRYVRGFMSPDTCGDRADVTLTGDKSHAWTEAYIEHIGWVRFDATPGYGGVSTDRWNTAEISGAGQMEEPHFQQEGHDTTEKTPTAPERTPAGRYVFAALKIAAVILLFFALAAAIALIRNALRRKKYARMDTGEKVRLQIKRLLRLGKLLGAPISDGETLQDYSERTQNIFAVGSYSLSDACALYEGVRFGGKSVSAQELCLLEDYAKLTERGYLASCGFLRKLFYRAM